MSRQRHEPLSNRYHPQPNNALVLWPASSDDSIHARDDNARNDPRRRLPKRDILIIVVYPGDALKMSSAARQFSSEPTIPIRRYHRVVIVLHAIIVVCASDSEPWYRRLISLLLKRGGACLSSRQPSHCARRVLRKRACRLIVAVATRHR